VGTSNKRSGYLFEEASVPLARGVGTSLKSIGTSIKRSRYFFEEDRDFSQREALPL
jgi:hypothetical protein